MGKELDLTKVRQVIGLRKQFLDTTSQKVKREEITRENREKALAAEIERKKRDTQIEAKKNRKRFEDAGIIKLLEDIRDGGLLAYYLDDKDKVITNFIYEPVHKSIGHKVRKNISRLKIKHYEPPHIEWKGTTQYEMSDGRSYDCGTNNDQVSIIFNYKWGPTEWSGGDKYFGFDYDTTRWDEISFSINNDDIYIHSSIMKRRGNHDTPQKISEISNIGQYLASLVSEAIN